MASMKMAMKMSMKMKAMKVSAKPMAMKMKAMKVSKVGKKRSVFSGVKVRTVGGLKKDDLKKSTSGKIVSKKASASAKRKPQMKYITKWSGAVIKARKQLGITGWCNVGGNSAKGQALLKAARSFYKK